MTVDPSPPDAAWQAVLGRLTVAAIVADRTGTIVFANPAVERTLGWPPESLVGQPVTVLVPRSMRNAHTQGFEQWAGDPGHAVDGRYLRVTAVTAAGGELAIGLVLSPVEGLDGTDWVLALLRPRDSETEAVNAVALELVSVLSHDRSIDDSVSRLLRALGERLGWDVTALWTVDEDRGVLLPTAQWTGDRDLHGAFLAACREAAFAPGVGLPGRVWATGAAATVDKLVADTNFPRREVALESGLRTGFGFPVEHDGRLVGVIELFRTRPDPIDSEHVAVLAGIGAHLGPYLQRVRSLERQARAELRMQIVTAAIEQLARWLDYPAPLDDVCELLVPAVAEACAIDLVRDGRLERLGHAYLNPALQADVELLDELAPLDTISAGPMAVVHSGDTLVYNEIAVDDLQGAMPAVPVDLLERLAPTSTIIVPLIGRGIVVGTMTLTRDERFDDDDRRFFEELGRHVGLAVANAALFERERSVAAALQQSLLPPRLPEVPGLEVASRYEPGGSRLVVGGDFYDLFEVAEGTWYAVVGDVCGTGAEAAAITSQVRYMARALAGRVEGPAGLMNEINAALLERDDTRFCTALIARLRPGPDGVAVTLSSGGHPPPVLVSRSGTRLVDCSGTLLGIYADATHDEVELTLADGEALALYTDGVIETRDAEGEMLGEERLVEVLDACVEEHADKTAAQLVQAAVEHAEFAPADDIAILVLRAE